MTPPLFLLVAAAGGVGAALRLLVDGVVRARGGRLPWATVVINLSGSLLLGLVTGLTAGTAPAWATVVGTGLLGGYTTFSTASVETVRLLQARRYAAAALTGPGQLVAATALALGGYALGLAV